MRKRKAISAYSADLIFLHDSWSAVEISEAETDKKTTRENDNFLQIRLRIDLIEKNYVT